MLKDLEVHPLFSKWKDGNKNCAGKLASPLPLLLLATLRYLGRGWYCDDCEEHTCISEETRRVFFHKFIEYGSTTLFEKHVVTPQNSEEAKTHMHKMNMAGLPGYVSITDETHIAMDCCSIRFRQLHIGFKMFHPSRAYNVSVNHRRRILFSTKGHPASWNDKTLQNFDTMMCKMRTGEWLSDVQFKLYDHDRHDNIIHV